MRYRCVSIAAATVFLSFPQLGNAKDIEPRRWTSLPTGMSIAGVGIVYTEGDIAFDPALELEDVSVESFTSVVSFLHSFELLGQSARFDVRIPYQDARWEGLLSGSPASTEQKGVGDPRLRLSVNFLGAPALKGKEFREYRASHSANTVVGAALAVTLPIGKYDEDRLLNLGGNRFVIRPQLGFVHTRGHWSYELTGSVFLYTDNNDFFGNNKREQDPLYALQTHLTYASSGTWWASIGAGYDLGGESTINGVKKDDERQDFLFGISTGLSINPSSSIKVAYIGNRTQKEIGNDSDSIAISYLTRF